MGLSLLATKDKARLVKKLTTDAAQAIDSYAVIDTVQIEASHLED